MKALFPSLLALALNASLAQAAIIVGLDEVDAFYNISGGNSLTTVSDPNAALGLTMNVTFTPDSTDIGQASNAIALLEIGGNANGTGLYLLGGQLHFLSKMGGTATGVVSSFDDLDFGSGNSMVGVRSSFGALTAGTEYSVGLVYDPNGAATLKLGILPTGGSHFTENWTFQNAGGTNGNWSGNDTVTSFSEAANAGAGNFVTGDAFQEGGPMNGLSGTAGQALLWNGQGTLVPEPSAALLASLGLLALLRRRR